MPIETNIDAAPLAAPAPRDVTRAVLAGARLCCPSCEKGRLFRAYLKVADACPQCGEELHHQRADDAPAYFTMVIVGHVIVGGILALEKAMKPDTWVHLVIWLPLLTIMTLGLLPRVKGALVGLQWALRMHGFGGQPETAEPDPAAGIGQGDHRA